MAASITRSTLYYGPEFQTLTEEEMSMQLEEMFHRSSHTLQNDRITERTEDIAGELG
jgi:hypothetical protein